MKNLIQIKNENIKDNIAINPFPKLEPLILLKKENLNTLRIELNPSLIDILKNDSDYKIITIGGYKSTGKKILFDTLPFILEHSDKNYQGIIHSCKSSVLDSKNFKMFPVPIKLFIHENTQEKIYFIRTEDFHLVNIYAHRDLNELKFKCLDKLYVLLLLISYAFILNLD